jgi:hypothetical protein
VRLPAYDQQPESSSAWESNGGLSDAEFDEMVRREMELLELQARSQLEPSRGNSSSKLPVSQRAQQYDNFEVEAPPAQHSRSGRSEAPSSDRQDKISRQQEYARQLLKDAEIKARGPIKSAGSEDGSRPRRAVVDEERRRKDAAVTQLDEGGLRFGERTKPSARQPDSEREAQLRKQKEYAMLLQSDMSRKAAVNAEEASKLDSPVKKLTLNRRKNRFDDDQEEQYTGLQIGHNLDKAGEREAKRRSQEEYAAQLRQASQQGMAVEDAPLSGRRRRQNEQADLGGGDGYTSLQLSGYDINTTQRIQNKRMQQQDYYHDLKEVETQQQTMRSAYDEKKDRLIAGGNRTSLAFPGNDISTVQKRSTNVAAQQKYSRELEEQIYASNRPPQDPYRDRVSLRKPTEIVEETDHPLGARNGGVAGLIGRQDDQDEAKLKKKLAQRDYARQLAQDSNSSANRTNDADPSTQRGKVSSARKLDAPKSPDKKKRPDELTDARRFAARALSLDEENLGATVFSTNYSKDKQNVEQFQSAPNTKATEYKDRQRAYAEMLALDSATRDSLREEAGDPSFNVAKQRAASTGRVRPNPLAQQRFGEAEGTGLMIGGMDVSTSLRLQHKKESQAKYARDIAAAASTPAIPSSYRSTIQERREHEVSGAPLPGNKRRPDLVDDYYNLGGGGYGREMNQPRLDAPAPSHRGGGGRDDFRARGTSTGGGQSTFSLY